ncbi:MAG: Unknown protein [uncultured Aureispira sp.]|uniref:Uncharacterized protein n=1 Tax=uncultured Aureispira sp. TaxID=1331704 RepID=A0A6S6S3T0_9BACT|nr:MAG: Unknown protein [uncultured Aureispira sp.]
MKKEYHFKGFYKIMSLISLCLMLVATILNAYLGEPIAMVFLLALIMIVLQYRRHTKPYIEIEKDFLQIRFTWLKTFKVTVAEIQQIDHSTKQITLHLRSGKQVGIYLGYLKAEDKKRALEDIPALLDDLN